LYKDDAELQVMIARQYKKYLPLLEFSLRLYIAYYLADYGIAKLTGGMFNNAKPEVLRTELQKVDMFHSIVIAAVIYSCLCHHIFDDHIMC